MLLVTGLSPRVVTCRESVQLIVEELAEPEIKHNVVVLRLVELVVLSIKSTAELETMKFLHVL
jgi:hypothetical protein